jgi:hypothetical protein
VGRKDSGLKREQRIACPPWLLPFPRIALVTESVYFAGMSTVTLNFEKEIEALEPEDAQSIQRALLEMLKLARKKSDGSVMPKREPYTLPSWNLGVRPGFDLTKLAHADEDDLSE